MDSPLTRRYAPPSPEGEGSLIRESLLPWGVRVAGACAFGQDEGGGESSGLHQRVGARIDGDRAEFFLDTDQLVVLGESVGAAE